MNVDLEQRLAHRFDVALAEARRDYPSVGLGLASTEPTARGGSRVRGWGGAVAAVGLVTVLAIGGLALVTNPPAAGPASGVPGSAAGTIPPTIDGQNVYTLAEQDNIPGSFLLRAYAVTAYIPCPATIDTPSTSADLDIYPDCGSVSLVPAPSGNSSFFFALAPKTRDLLTPWLGGPEIVIRVHHHDAAAAGCSAVFRSQCETALVVEAVVWPAVPPTRSASAVPTESKPSLSGTVSSSTVPQASASSAAGVVLQGGVPISIAGEKVHDFADRDQWQGRSDGFLLTGYVIGLIDNGACDSSKTAPPVDMSLVDATGCDGLLFADGTTSQAKYVAIAMKSIDLVKPWLSMLGSPVRVIVRAHTNDPSAVNCTPAYRAACKNALVIDSVVWPS